MSVPRAVLQINTVSVTHGRLAGILVMGTLSRADLCRRAFAAASLYVGVVRQSDCTVAYLAMRKCENKP